MNQRSSDMKRSMVAVEIGKAYGDVGHSTPQRTLTPQSPCADFDSNSSVVSSHREGEAELALQNVRQTNTGCKPLPAWLTRPGTTKKQTRCGAPPGSLGVSKCPDGSDKRKCTSYENVSALDGILCPVPLFVGAATRNCPKHVGADTSVKVFVLFNVTIQMQDKQTKLQQHACIDGREDADN